MQNKSFIIKLVSASRIESKQLLPFVRRVRDFFSADELSGELICEESRATTNFENAELLLTSELPDWRGTLTIVFGDQDGLSVRCDLLRLENFAGNPDLAGHADYRTNEITLEVDHHRVAQICKRIPSFLLDSAMNFDALYALGNDNDGFMARMHGAHGIASGIPDIYAITVFGSSFSFLIDDLEHHDLPPGVAIKAQGTHKMVQIGDDFCTRSQIENETNRAAVRAKLNDKYFIGKQSPSFLENRQRLGFASFLISALKASRSSTRNVHVERLLECVDWSGIYYPESENARTGQSGRAM